MKGKLILEQMGIGFIVSGFFFPEALKFVKSLEKHRHFLIPMLWAVAQFIGSIWTR